MNSNNKMLDDHIHALSHVYWQVSRSDAYTADGKQDRLQFINQVNDKLKTYYYDEEKALTLANEAIDYWLSKHPDIADDVLDQLFNVLLIPSRDLLFVK